jgi:hypothetical protein
VFGKAKEVKLCTGITKQHDEGAGTAGLVNKRIKYVLLTYEGRTNKEIFSLYPLSGSLYSSFVL